MSKTTTQKPAKPYAGYPLTAHANGQWCKKIRGKLHYFGPWSDPTAALNLYLDQRDDLQAGRKPRQRGDNSPTLGYALDHFLSAKMRRVKAQEISKRSYDDYVATCIQIAESIGKHRPLSDVAVDDLQNLRKDLSMGKEDAEGNRRKRGPTTFKNELTRARVFFLYANDYLLEKPLPYRKTLAPPDKKLFREVANRRGPRMFKPEEILAALEIAPPQLKAMIYLGINCGFGNHDCGTLPIDRVDLEAGWHTYWRPKTHNPRRCPLWPETAKALKEAMAIRPKREEENTRGLMFVTKYGNPWSTAEEDREGPISYEFRKLLLTVGVYRKNITTFYTLRRTFETVAAATGEQVAIDHIMGHIAPTNDMAAVYRQQVFDEPLLKVTNHVRGWLLGSKQANG